jgi:hypothetical protein
MSKTVVQSPGSRTPSDAHAMAARSSKPFTPTLEALLRERDWSVRRLSRETKEVAPPGIAHVTLRSMMVGDMAVSMRAMEAIAKACLVSPEHFAEYRLEAKREALNWRKRSLRSALRELGE